MRGPIHRLNPQCRATLVEAIRVGLYKEVAAGRAGISIATFMSWLHKAREDRAMGRKPLPFDPKANNWIGSPNRHLSKELDLLEAIEKAEHDRLAESLLHIRDAAKGGVVVERTTKTTLDAQGRPVTVVKEKLSQPQWTAAAWLAERTRPGDYALRRTELSGPNGGPVQVGMVLTDLIRASAEEDEAEKAAQAKKEKQQ